MTSLRFQICGLGVSRNLRSFTSIQERNVHFKDREGTEHPKVLPREHVALVGSSGVGNLNLGGILH